MGDIELAFYTGSVLGDDLLVVSGLFKSFFTVNLKNKIVQWLDIDFNICGFDECVEFKKAIQYGECVYFWGILGIGCYKISLKSKTAEFFSLKKGIYTADSLLIDGNKLLIPTVKPWEEMYIYKFDEDELVEVHANVLGLKELCVSDKDCVLNTVLSEDIVYFPIVNRDVVLLFDLKSNKFGFLSLLGHKPYGVAKYEKKLIFSLHGTHDILLYDTDTEGIEEIRIDSTISIDTVLPAYAQIYVSGTEIFLLPATKGDVIRTINIETEETIEYKYPDGFEVDKIEQYLYQFYGHTCMGDTEYIYPLSANMMLEINKTNHSINGYNIVVTKDNDNKEKILKAISGTTIKERREIGIEQFLEIIGE